MKENVWEKYSEQDLDEMNVFCEGYKDFISECKTEREVIKFATNLAKKAGFLDLNDVINQKIQPKPGDKVYALNMDKALMLYVLGTEDFEKGLKIVGSHVDSPRLDIKATPLYENSGFCMVDTHYYGGIKKYQWVARPLALHGVVVKKDGTKIDLSIGEKDDEPVFYISDLLPHLDRNPSAKKDVVEGENLNIIGGTIPNKDAKKDKIKATVISALKQYGFEEDDLFSAELEAVPAGRARDCGFDKSLIAGYGQDDRVCAYTSLLALMRVQNPKHTCCCMLVDKEEIGSFGATGMQSKFFENSLAEIMNACGEYGELNLRRALTNSQMISSDVTAGFDPNYPGPMNKETDAILCGGLSFNKYTGSRGKSGANDANPEFIAKLRKILDENNISYQATEMGKVDEGGGGTIAFILASYGMEVIDAGVPLLSMHAPTEIAAKPDIFEAQKFYHAFYLSD